MRKPSDLWMEPAFCHPDKPIIFEFGVFTMFCCFSRNNALCVCERDTQRGGEEGERSWRGGELQREREEVQQEMQEQQHSWPHCQKDIEEEADLKSRCLQDQVRVKLTHTVSCVQLLGLQDWTSRIFSDCWMRFWSSDWLFLGRCNCWVFRSGWISRWVSAGLYPDDL